jgi:hypothetical protein
MSQVLFSELIDCDFPSASNAMPDLLTGWARANELYKDKTITVKIDFLTYMIF